jgi:hypothetical protein
MPGVIAIVVSCRDFFAQPDGAGDATTVRREAYGMLA